MNADPRSGSVYLFVRSTGVWSQQQKLTASEPTARDQFGASVAISGDTMLVGSIGSTYVFVRSAGVWSQQQKLGVSGSLAISGETAVVGDPSHGDSVTGFHPGSTYVFVRSAGVWSQQQKLTASDGHVFDSFGDSVTISGDTVVVGAPENGSGSAYVFVRSGGVWSQQQKLAASDLTGVQLFGGSVVVRGDTAVVGSPFDDNLGPHSPHSGSVYVFVRNAGVWSQQQKLTASDATASEEFGWSVALSENSAVAGAPFPGDAGPSIGSAYVYEPGPISLNGLSPAKVWVGLKNSDDVGIRFDLLARVSLNDVPVGSGQLDGALGGSSGFNNAKLDSIPLKLSAPVAVASGETLSIEILVRNACSGSGRSSGTARLWYGGKAVDSGTKRDAGSRFDATIGLSRSDYFLRRNFDLDTAAGSVQLFVDKAAGVKCSAFASFGTWSRTLP